MSSYVLGFQEIDTTKLALVGGKGANLGELSRIEGIQVPQGFCVTTEAYKEIVGKNAELHSLLDQLSLLKADNREGISEISAKIRKLIEGIAVPQGIDNEITRHLEQLGENNAYAVRSSATAEDLPTASFAGQQDTYLNIIGKDAIVQHISKCWASLFTDRAVTYRIQNGFDHRKVHLSVVIQKMVFPQAAGILFTADPVTSNRKVTSIDASFGLGEALVSGLVNADNYKVRDGRIVDKKISTKKLAIYALKDGGTEEKRIEAEHQKRQTLTDEQIVQLERMGRRIEAYFGCPQDIEWCLASDTLLYRAEPSHHHLISHTGREGWEKPCVYVFRPSTDDDRCHETIGVIFFSVRLEESSHSSRWKVVHRSGSRFGFSHRTKDSTLCSGQNRPSHAKRSQELMKRKAFMKALSRGKRSFRMGAGYFSWALPVQAIKIYRSNDASIVKTLMSRNEAAMRDLQLRIANLSGDELFDFILEAHKQLKEAMVDPRSMGVVYVGVYAANWINKKMEKWLGEKGAADLLSQSVANNVTSEMGLALLDVADIVRQYPAVMEYLQHANDETFFADLARLEGGDAVSHSLRAYLEKYGMRCAGEIDITRPRWNEQPTALIPMILSNIRNFEPGAHKAIFEQGGGKRNRRNRICSIVWNGCPWKRKAKKAKKMISVLRNFAGYREYPKYLRFVITGSLSRPCSEAVKLEQKGVIQKKEDIYYLSFEELREVIRTSRLDYSIITKRKEEYEVYEKLTPPRVMTSEGEVLSGEYDTGSIPKGALAGIPVSSGIIEGRARVILRMEDADIEEGDILVTTYTDPSWTPVFVSIKGLVTEVGGMMTHGAVIAREYGLPAVVGVENATKLIKDGQGFG